MKATNSVFKWILGRKRFISEKLTKAQSYPELVSALLKSHDKKQAMSLAVGGEFEALGLLEYHLLLQVGLKKDDTVIDVGCGSGRLAVKLAPFLDGRYLGIDVVPELLRYAEELCQRPDWSFKLASGVKIPAGDDSSDIICFFSVFTHLLHQDSFLYLQDAKRVAKKGGHIVFSFLDFSIPSHWYFFEHSLKEDRPNHVLTQFMSKDAIETWAQHLDLKVEAICDGDKPHIPLSETVKFDSGHEMREMGNLGQSICVLSK